MSNKFTEALGYLGHIYEPRPPEFIPDDKVRHVLKVFKPTGDIKAICGAPEVRGVGCPALRLDANCERCREIEGLPVAITKRSLMLDLINALCDIEQMFLDAMYWNLHNRDKAPFNPDPDGELAKAWLIYKAQIDNMIVRFQPTMENHETRFSWPDSFENTD